MGNGMQCAQSNPPTLAVTAKLAAGQFIHRGGTALGAAGLTATLIAGLLEEFPLPQFFLDPGVLHQLTETPHGILN